MESKRLVKIGEASQTSKGEKVLINEAGTAYTANDTILTIWNCFDGNTVDEVANQLATVFNREPNELVTPVNELATELEKADLLHSK